MLKARVHLHRPPRLRKRRLHDQRLDQQNRYSRNAHHDSEETCGVKPAMCREKVALFEGRGIDVSNEEVMAAVVAQEEAEEAGVHGPGDNGDGEKHEVEDDSEEDS